MKLKELTGHGKLREGRAVFLREVAGDGTLSNERIAWRVVEYIVPVQAVCDTTLIRSDDYRIKPFMGQSKGFRAKIDYPDGTKEHEIEAVLEITPDDPS